MPGNFRGIQCTPRDVPQNTQRISRLLIGIGMEYNTVQCSAVQYSTILYLSKLRLGARVQLTPDNSNPRVLKAPANSK